MRWKSGASQDLLVHRLSRVTEWRRTAPAALALAREAGPAMTNRELAATLNAAGHTTGTGKPFDTTAASNLRHAYRIGSPELLGPGEFTVRAVAGRLGVAIGVVHAWLAAGTLTARRSPSGRWAIPFPPELEAACQARLADSPHIHQEADDQDRQPGELSIAEVAARLGVKPDVVYYWAKRGHLSARRGKSGRRWVLLTAETEAACRSRIARSYKLPEDVKAAHHMEGIAV